MDGLNLAENDHPPSCQSSELRCDGAPLVFCDGVKRKGFDLHDSATSHHATLFCVRSCLVWRIGDHMIDAPIRQAGETGDGIEAVAEVDDVRERAHAASPNRGVCASHHWVPGRCGASMSATEHQIRSASTARAADGCRDFGSGGT